MSSTAEIDHIHQKVKLFDLQPLFAEKSWAGITTDDRIAPSTVAVVADTDTTTIKLMEIALDVNGVPFMRTKRTSVEGTKLVPIFAAISEAFAKNATGLPAPILRTLIQDLKDFQNLTGFSAVTRVHIGKILGDEWQTASNPHRLCPGMIRDISNQGIYYAASVSTDGDEVGLQTGAGAEKVSSKSPLKSYKLAAGERLFYTNGLLVREAKQTDDNNPAPVRAYTTVYSF